MAAIIGIVNFDPPPPPPPPAAKLRLEIRFQLLPPNTVETILHLSRGAPKRNSAFLCCAVDHLISYCRYVNNRLWEHTRHHPESTGIRWLILYQLPFISTLPIAASRWICVIAVILVSIWSIHIRIYIYKYIYIIYILYIYVYIFVYVLADGITLR